MGRVLTGKQSRTTFGVQSDYDTPATADRWFGIVQKAEDSPVADELKEIKGIDETTLNRDGYERIVQRYGLDGTILPQTGVPIALAFGKDTGSDVGGGVFQHDISEDILKILTIEVVNKETAGDNVETYVGNIIDTFKHEWTAGNLSMITMSLIGKELTTGTVVTPVNTSNEAYQKYTSVQKPPFHSENIDVTIGGVDVPTCISGFIELSHALKADTVCNNETGDKVHEPQETDREFTFEAKGYLPTQAYLDSLRSLKTGDIVPGTTKVLFTRGVNDTIEYTMVSPTVESFTKPYDVDGERVEFTMVLKPLDVTVKVIDDIGNDYIDGIAI